MTAYDYIPAAFTRKRNMGINIRGDEGVDSGRQVNNDICLEIVEEIGFTDRCPQGAFIRSGLTITIAQNCIRLVRSGGDIEYDRFIGVCQCKTLPINLFGPGEGHNWYEGHTREENCQADN